MEAGEEGKEGAEEETLIGPLNLHPLSPGQSKRRTALSRSSKRLMMPVRVELRPAWMYGANLAWQA